MMYRRTDETAQRAVRPGTNLPESKYRKVWVVSAYINKKSVTQVPNDEISSLGFTSETELASPPSDNSIPENGGNVKYSFRKNVGIDKYTYDALVKKADMPVTVLDSEVDYRKRNEVLNLGMENVKKQNNPNNTDTKSYVYVKDIGKHILVGKGGLRHGLAHDRETTSKVTAQIGDILKNSIAINELTARENTSGGYVLMGLGIDKEGIYYPTRIIINNYELDGIELFSGLYAVNAKKENRSGHPAEFTHISEDSNSSLSDITIADFLDVVKDYFADILPQNVLEPGFKSIYADTKLCSNLF